MCKNFWITRGLHRNVLLRLAVNVDPIARATEGCISPVAAQGLVQGVPVAKRMSGTQTQMDTVPCL